MWHISRSFDQNFKIHSFNKFSRLLRELRLSQLEAKLLRKQPVKSYYQESIFELNADRKYYKFIYNYEYSQRQ